MPSAILSLFFCLAVSAESPLKWPERYTAVGNIILPYADINEPFEAVVDMSKGLSSLSTYNGMCSILTPHIR